MSIAHPRGVMPQRGGAHPRSRGGGATLNPHPLTKTEKKMNRIGKIATGFALAAGVFGSSAAMAMDDYVTNDSMTTYYYDSPGTTYQYSPPSTMYYMPPRTTYSETDVYDTPNGVYGYYDNRYNPYWS